MDTVASATGGIPGTGCSELASAAGSPRPRRTVIQAVAASCLRCCPAGAATRPCWPAGRQTA